MDDLLLARLLLMTSRVHPLLLREFYEDQVGPPCDLCRKIPKNNQLTKCIFCEKSFCVSCCGKEKTRICRNCNFMIATTVNHDVLKRFSVKELRVLTDNYNISLKNMIDKEEWIKAILINFKKSIENNTEPVVNVTELKEKMNYLKLEDYLDKQKRLDEEREQSSKFADYSKIPIKETELNLNINMAVPIELEEADVPNMSNKDLKELLDRFEVDYHSILEKKELVSVALAVVKHYNKFKKPQDDPGIKIELECKICMTETIACVFLDCGHSMCCYECGGQLLQCPICREKITRCFKIVIG